MLDYTLEDWPISRLSPYANNPRKNDHVVNKMVKAIKTFGFRVPILVTSEGRVIDGHLRLKAAHALGYESVPVLVSDQLSPQEIKAFRILINKSAVWASWDDELLSQEIHDLVSADFDISLTGFEQGELDKLLAENAVVEKDPNVVPNVEQAPAVTSGEVWILGSHRLLCGDSLSGVDVARLLQGDELDMVWTDPPYNVDYQGKAGSIKNDKMTEDEFDSFLYKSFALLFSCLKPGGAIYISHSESGGGLAFRLAFHKAGFRFSSCLIWDKGQMVLSRGDYHWQHEPILYGWKPGAPHNWFGDRKQKTVVAPSPQSPLLRQEDGSISFVIDGSGYQITGDNLEVSNLSGSIIKFPKPSKSSLHPTTKPVEIITPAVVNSSQHGALVGEPFCGSGSTLMACEVTGRRCRAMELDPKFVQVAIVRWQNYTGKLAYRESDGMSFDELFV